MQRKFKEKLSSWVAAGLFGLLYLTYRFPILSDEGDKRARTIHPKGQVAIAIWHRNSIGSLLSFARQRLAILVSLSFDGEVIAYVAKVFGIHSARGSSSRGGMEAFKQLLTMHRSGFDLGITVDGPRGPIYKVKPGIIAVAARTGVPILPFAAIADREWVLTRAWDQFRVPKPFAKIYRIYGEPIIVPKTTETQAFEEFSLTLETALLALEETVRLHLASIQRPK